MLYVSSCQYLTSQEKILAKSELSQEFGGEQFEKGAFVSFKRFKVNPKSSRVLKPLKKGP